MNTLEEFITRYNDFTNAFYADYTSMFESFEERYSAFKTDYRDWNLKEAEDFNIFQLLGVAHYEVGTHSSMLRELLDSNGRHGQGNIFFKSFLEMLADKNILEKDDVNKITPILFDNYSCEAERSVDTGRIDIIIERLDGAMPFCMIIENKIYAEDQENQIERYLVELQKKQARKKLILYLTLNGDSPSEYSLKKNVMEILKENRIFFCISYKKDILLWLLNILPEVQSNKVRSIIKQYIEVLNCL